MSSPDPQDRLRKLVPFLVAAIFFQVVCFVFVLSAKEKIELWPLLVFDQILPVTALVVLWRALGRKR